MGHAAHNACDPLSPRQVRYQAALYRENGGSRGGRTHLSRIKSPVHSRYASDPKIDAKMVGRPGVEPGSLRL